MKETSPLPRFNDSVKEFAADLRFHVFSTQTAAAQYFGVSPSTIHRYEHDVKAGRMIPPLGYLAALATLIVERRAHTEEDRHTFRSHLLRELNRAIHVAYPDKRPFTSWAEVEQAAQDFLAARKPPHTSPPRPTSAPTLVDWGDAPLQGSFYGRDEERKRLRTYILEERRQLIGIWGAGGIGKTALAARVAQDVAPSFECVLWRSLRNAPRPTTFLQNVILVLSPQHSVELGADVESLILTLIDILRQRRCLLVIDNLESILQTGAQAGFCQEGYRAYCDLIRRLGETPHNSCVILTGRERPAVFALWQGRLPRVASLEIRGMDLESARTYLQDLGLSTEGEDWKSLVHTYGGNPLMLALSAETIREIFHGDIRAFLRSGHYAVGDVRALLEEQVSRLSPLEQDIMAWLAIEREPVPPDVLAQDILDPGAASAIPPALTSLRRRHLIERVGTHFTLQNVIMEYMTDRILEGMEESVVKGDLRYMDRYTLMKTTVPEYVREHQVRVLLEPLLAALRSVYGSDRRVERRLRDLVRRAREMTPPPAGYAGGNLFNLLGHLRGALDDQDFAELTLRHIHARGLSLRNASLAQAHVVHGHFSHAFSFVLDVAFSSDGRYLAAGLDNRDVWVWRLPQGTEGLVLSGHKDSVRAVVFHPQRPILATGDDKGIVRLWDLEENACIKTISAHAGRVRALAFSPDGTSLFSGSDDGFVRQWTLTPPGRLVREFPHEGEIRSLAVHPSGEWIATGTDRTRVFLWDARKGEQIAVRNIQGHVAWGLAFHPRDPLLAGGMYPKGIFVWRVPSLRRVATPESADVILWDVTFSPQGDALIAIGDDWTVRIWRTRDWRLERTFLGHMASPRGVDVHPGGRYIASGGRDYTVRLWDREKGEQIRVFSGYHNIVTHVELLPDRGIIVTGDSDGTLRQWSPDAGTPRVRWGGHRGSIRSIAVHPGRGWIVTGGDDGRVLIREVESGRVIRKIRQKTPVLAVALDAAGETVAVSATDTRLHLWDISTGERIRVLEGHTSWVEDILFTPEGTLISASDDRTIRLWDVKEGRTVRILRGHTSWIYAIALSPQGDRLASASEDRTVRLWDLASGQEIRVLEGHEDLVWDVTWSWDGRWVAGASPDGTACVWDVESGRLVRRFNHGERVSAVRFLPHSPRLITGGEDGVLRVWDVLDGTLVRTLGPDRLYENLDITGTSGLTPAQRHSLIALGAVQRTGKEEPTPSAGARRPGQGRGR